MLNKLVEKLYNERGNIAMISKLNDFDQEKLQDLLYTPSKNKNLVKGLNLTNCGYLRVKLTDLGIRYYENGFKFDREIKESSVTIQVENNNGNISGINNGTQNINNQIDEIIKLLEKKDIGQKTEIKKLLEEYKRNGDKKSLEKLIGILGNLSSAGSLITGIIGLLS